MIRPVALSGIFTGVPVTGVREMPVTTALNDRSEILGGGARGVAVSTTLTVALPLTGGGTGVTLPLQECSEKATPKTAKRSVFFCFIEAPLL